MTSPFLPAATASYVPGVYAANACAPVIRAKAAKAAAKEKCFLLILILLFDPCVHHFVFILLLKLFCLKPSWFDMKALNATSIQDEHWKRRGRYVTIVVSRSYHYGICFSAAGISLKRTACAPSGE